MKTTNRTFLAVTTIALALAFQAKAQIAAPEKAVAASPKIRQTLSDQKARTTVVTQTPVVLSYALQRGDNLAASPKVRAMLNETKTIPGSLTEPVVMVAQSGQERIAASPKLREQLKERTPSFQIAPLK